MFVKAFLGKVSEVTLIQISQQENLKQSPYQMKLFLECVTGFHLSEENYMAKSESHIRVKSGWFSSTGFVSERLSESIWLPTGAGSQFLIA